MLYLLYIYFIRQKMEYIYNPNQLISAFECHRSGALRWQVMCVAWCGENLKRFLSYLIWRCAQAKVLRKIKNKLNNRGWWRGQHEVVAVGLKTMSVWTEPSYDLWKIRHERFFKQKQDTKQNQNSSSQITGDPPAPSRALKYWSNIPPSILVYSRTSRRALSICVLWFAYLT